jgi:single-stranded-DNA-specific exonuclease
MQRRWIFPKIISDPAVGRLGEELKLPEVLAGILVRNACQTSEDVEAFLHPKLRTLSDPTLLPDMSAACTRVLQALERRELIVLYGDYDVDGVTSLALLKRLLCALGGEVECFLPHRVDEGYGLSPSGVARCFEEFSPALLLAVDCGTNSAPEVADIRARGADVIILDHHEPSAARPDCTALVNPKLGDAFHYLCSAGVVFKLAHALLRRIPTSGIDLREYLDLVALATVADLVPLVGENRILVRRGLHQMSNTRWPGLRALMEVADVRGPVRGSDVGFRLGPRINAAGRLGTATAALRLLLAEDPGEAARIASELDRQNGDRRTVEQDVAREVETWIDRHFDAARDASIVAGHPGWHHGVLGIVASRVMRRHHRPTVLIGFDEKGLGKGSGRSIAGFSLVEALGQCAGHLEKFGGHDMAAGVTVRQDRLESFRTLFEQSARQTLTDEILTPKLHLDGELPVEDISLSLLEAQEMFEPYGMSNPQPLYATRGMTPTTAPRILKEKHLQLNFSKGRHRVQAIYFNGAEEELPRTPWDVAFTLERNEFRGQVNAQMKVVAIRSSAK